MDRNEENKVIGLNDQILEELNKAIDDMTLFDDDLMSKVFDGNTEATELLLSIILERDDIKVLRVKGQVDMRSPYVGGRSIRLDIHAVLGDGTEFDLKSSEMRKALIYGEQGSMAA